MGLSHTPLFFSFPKKVGKRKKSLTTLLREWEEENALIRLKPCPDTGKMTVARVREKQWSLRDTFFVQKISARKKFVVFMNCHAETKRVPFDDIILQQSEEKEIFFSK